MTDTFRFLMSAFDPDGLPILIFAEEAAAKTLRCDLLSNEQIEVALTGAERWAAAGTLARLELLDHRNIRRWEEGEDTDFEESESLYQELPEALRRCFVERRDRVAALMRLVVREPAEFGRAQ